MESETENRIVQLILSRYLSDPEGFRALMPEVAKLLDDLRPLSSQQNQSFIRNESERSHHKSALAELMTKLDKETLSSDEAIKALEHCAVLISDNSLPENANHDSLTRLLTLVIGKSPETFRSTRTISIVKDSRKHTGHVSLVRGVNLNLDEQGDLISVNIDPAKVKERRKLMQFVGMGKDCETDVAANHDKYLAEFDPHATA